MAINTPQDFRDALAKLGLSQTGFAREMARLGDPRPPNTLLRAIQRTATGENKVSGEMHVVLGLMMQLRALQTAAA